MNRQTKVEKGHTEKKFTSTLDWKDYDQNLDKQHRKNSKRLVLARSTVKRRVILYNIQRIRIW